MEMSRRENVRPFQAVSGNNFHQTKMSNVGIQPLLGKSWQPSLLFNKNKQFSSVDAPPIKEVPPSNSLYNVRPPKFRDSHPYRKNPPLQNYIKPKTCINNIPPLVSTDLEIKPQPLIPQETLEQLTRLRYSSNKLNNQNTKDWKYKEKQIPYGAPPVNESTNMNGSGYIQDEQNKVKQKIDELIVAHAMREKLKREEEMIRNSGLTGNLRNCNYDQDYSKSQVPTPVESPVMRPLALAKILPNSTFSNNIPRLMDLKPKIPNLMDLCVTPPDMENVIQENLMVAKSRYDSEPGSPDKCWNCDRAGHRYVVCHLPRLKKFCFRCGRPKFDVINCLCKLNNPLKL